MKVVGLVSGGKDSIWNLHYCRHFGHELVCVANLAPPHGVDELDSYMYQTVGSTIIDAIAEALGVPLIRRVIAGKPKETGSMSYTPQDGDEVEDLTLLLKQVLQEYEVEAVSCGAILSNYQRLRVENVCNRLGLKVVAFMWMQEQTLLLQQMVDSEIDARIVKVASMGLTRNHVGATILDPIFFDMIHKLGQKWGLHVCGEGGEYESIVVDSPLFCKRILIERSEVINHPDGNDDVAWMHTEEVGVEQKSADGTYETPSEFYALKPYSNLEYYQETFPMLVCSGPASSISPATLAINAVKFRIEPCVAPPAENMYPTIARVGANLFATSSLDASSLDLGMGAAELTPAEQCDALLCTATLWLTDLLPGGRGLRDALLVEVQVADLGCFEKMNSVYNRHFSVDPPPRLCIETPLPDGIHLRIRMFLQSNPDAVVERLRVQSISTWAMACIGPYSQAARVDDCLFTAGVIGLVPHRMTLPSAEEVTGSAGKVDPPPENWEAELWLTMRSLQNVLVEMKSSLSKPCLAQVYVAKRAAGKLNAVAERVKEYMRREGQNCDPLLVCAVVPRLPKDGLVEVAFICGSADEKATCTVTEDVQTSPTTDLAGTFRTSVRRGPGSAWVSYSAFHLRGNLEVYELKLDDFKWVVARCLCGLHKALEKRFAIGDTHCVSLLVQYAAEGSHAIVEDAFNSVVDAAGGSPLTVASFMPVAGLPNNAILQLTSVSSDYSKP